MNANVRWQMLILWILNLWKPAEQSIVGVTYRDNFDFEKRERYRNRHECDPLYWHPLHMLDHCNHMFEDLILTRIADKRPLDDRAKKETEIFRKLFHLQKPRDSSEQSSEEDSNCSSSDESCSDRSEESDDDYILDDREKKLAPRLKMPPYFEMLNMVQDDAIENPAAPVFGILPTLGLSAIYRQSVSAKTENMIKKVSGAYSKAAQDTYKEIGPFYPPPLLMLPVNNYTSPNPKTTFTVKPTKVSQNNNKVIHKVLQINKLS